MDEEAHRQEAEPLTRDGYLSNIVKTPYLKQLYINNEETFS